jgi:hypothetical protein
MPPDTPVGLGSDGTLRTSWLDGSSNDDDTTEIREPKAIREELIAIAHECMETGLPPDTGRLEKLANELHYAAVSAVMLGRVRDAIAAENYAQATEETAEIARLLRANARAAA